MHLDAAGYLSKVFRSLTTGKEMQLGENEWSNSSLSRITLSFKALYLTSYLFTLTVDTEIAILLIQFLTHRKMGRDGYIHQLTKLSKEQNLLDMHLNQQ